MYPGDHDPEEAPPTADRFSFGRWGRPRHTGMTPRNCCCCIPTQIGSLIACVVWAGFSLYFAVLAFMGRSPLVIFGVLNLFFFIVCVGAFIIIKWQATPYLLARTTQLVWTFALLILVDMFCNFVVFLVKSSDYRAWCFNLSEGQVQDAYRASLSNGTTTSNATIPLNPSIDYYNCARLYQDQTTWTLACLAAMIMVYVRKKKPKLWTRYKA
ncbi:hypothetical protein BC940DRAFT_79741 [Gongronella butleri]|nr:hypothetical protein BC940DRAFT_79741 [Gongronella butleri]